MHQKPSITVFFILIILSQLSAQVQAVQFLMEPDHDEGLIECKIKILEGSASSLFDRAQLNSQYSIAVPTGAEVEVVESLHPLQGNQNYQGTTPSPWIIGSKVVSPESVPENDYYSITPQLTPTGFYNNLAEGDVVHLFTIRVTTDNDCDATRARVYNSDRDPRSDDPGMFGGDFSCGFVLGNLLQLYAGHINTEELAAPKINQSAMNSGNCNKIEPQTACVSSPISYEWSTGESTKSIEVCPGQNQYYTVTITDGSGSEAISRIDFDITDFAGAIGLVSSTLDDTAIAGIYPNPVHELLHVQALYPIDLLEIMTLDGRLVERIPGNHLVEQSIQMQNYQQGPYLLQVSAEGHRETQQIMKF